LFTPSATANTSVLGRLDFLRHIAMREVPVPSHITILAGLATIPQPSTLFSRQTYDEITSLPRRHVSTGVMPSWTPPLPEADAEEARDEVSVRLAEVCRAPSRWGSRSVRWSHCKDSDRNQALDSARKPKESPQSPSLEVGGTFDRSLHIAPSRRR